MMLPYFLCTKQKLYIDGFVIAISKMAEIKFLTEEELAYEIEDDP